MQETDLLKLHALLEGTAAARRRASAARVVVEAYLKVPDSLAAAEAAARARCDWEDASGDACNQLREAVRVADRMTEETVHELIELRAVNERLRTDNARLRLELRRELGVEPKAMTAPDSPASPPETTPEGGPPAQPGADSPPRRRGAPKGHRGATRIAPGHVDTTRDLPSPSTCTCGCTEIDLRDDYDEQYVEDIAPILRTVTLVRARRGQCRGCGATVHSPQFPAGPQVVTGPNLASLLTVLRQMGLTERKLAFFCTDMMGIPLTASGAMGIVNRVCDRIMLPTAEVIQSALRTQPWLGVDETGWRIERKNGYIWCFCNQNLVYYYPDHSRAGEVPKRILGEDYPGTAACDFYAAYNFLPKLQRCWVHLLRAIADERTIRPACLTLLQFETDVHEAYRRAKEVRDMPPGEQRDDGKAELRRTLDRLAATALPKGRPQAIARRLSKHRDNLLRFIDEPGVPPHNNGTERQIRPVVVKRKNSFGSDTVDGAKRFCALASVLETCRLSGIRAITWVRDAIAAPPGQLPSPFAAPPSTTG